MTITPLPGTAYHRLARTAAHRWWRPVVGTVVVLAGSLSAAVTLMCLTTLAAFAAGRPQNADGVPTFGPVAEAAMILLFIGVALPVVLLTARWVQARPAGTVSSVTGRLRWRWLALCLLPAVPAVLTTLFGGWGLLALTGAVDTGQDDGSWVGWPAFAVSVGVLVLLVPLQAAAEEYVCRGWLLQAVGAFVRSPWPAIGLQALLFAAAHGWGTPYGFVALVVFGVLTGWLTVRTGGLEAAVALHVVNNLTGFTAAAAFGMLAGDGSAADMAWQMLVADVVALTGYTVVVLRLARWRRVDPVVPPVPAADAGPVTEAGPDALTAGPDALTAGPDALTAGPAPAARPH